MATNDDRVAIITGDGTSFSAGADLKTIPHDLFRAIPGIGVLVDKPVIAAVKGWCIVGGIVLTTKCDLLFAADDAMFSYPKVKIGFFGGLISTLACHIPHKNAMDYAVRIAAQAPLPSKMLKCFIAETIPKSPTEIGGIAQTQVNTINASDDGAEGIAAFLGKRPPKLKGR